MAALSLQPVTVVIYAQNEGSAFTLDYKLLEKSLSGVDSIRTRIRWRVIEGVRPTTTDKGRLGNFYFIDLNIKKGANSMPLNATLMDFWGDGSGNTATLMPDAVLNSLTDGVFENPTGSTARLLPYIAVHEVLHCLGARHENQSDLNVMHEGARRTMRAWLEATPGQVYISSETQSAVLKTLGFKR